MSYLTLVLANLRDKSARSLLTVLALMIAFLLFGLLRPIGTVFSEGPSLNDIGRLVVTPKHSTSDMLPLQHASRIAALEQVSVTSHLTWFGGYFRETGNAFPQFAVPAESFLETVPELEIVAGDIGQFSQVRRAAIIGTDLSEQYGWQPGDLVPLIPTIWHNRQESAWEFEIVAIYRSKAGGLLTNNSLYFDYAYFDEYRALANGTIGSILVIADNPEAAATVSERIDVEFQNSAAETQTLTDQEYARSFARQLANVAPAILAILGAVFFTLSLLTANTMAQAIRERRRHIAVLGVLGFSPGTIVALTLAEALIMCVCAAMAGLLLAQLILQYLPELIPEFAQLGELGLSGHLAGSAFGIAVGIALFAALPPAISTLRTSPSNALRV